MDIDPISGPAAADILAVLSVDQLKAELRVLYDDENAVLQGNIVDAYGYFDGRAGWLRRALLTQQWHYYRHGWWPKRFWHRWPRHYSNFIDPYLGDPSGPIEIPLPPLQSVDEVAYRDDTDTWQIVDPSVYEVITGTLFGQVVLARGQAWPNLTHRPRAVRIAFTAGYPADANGNPTVPGGIVRAVKLLAGSLFNNREASFEDTRVTYVARKIEYGIEKLAGRHRIANDLVESF